jgi:spore maturation protein CgeB
MKILTVLESNSWADYHLAGSLEDMGHDVTRFFYGAGVGEFYGRQRSAEQAEKNAALYQLARELAKNGQLDFIFCYVYDDFLLPDTARRLAALDVPMTNLNVDMVNQWYRQIRTAKYFTRMLCAHHDNIKSMKRYGATPIYFPMAGRIPPERAVNTFELHAPVTFVGTPAPYRKRVISYLHQAKIPLAVYGKFWNEHRVARADRNREKMLSDLRHYGWPRLRAEGIGSLLRVLKTRMNPSARDVTYAQVCGSILHGFVPDGAMTRLFRESKINLGMTRMIGEDPFAPGVCQVKLRDFEVPLAGGFYLVEKAPEYELLFEFDKEVVTWRNPSELCEKIAYFLEHEDKRLSIAAAGRQRALQEHTWDRRFESLFDELGISH